MGAIDRSSHRPAYLQLADLLREQILTGALPAGAAMPSRSQLAAEHHLALATIAQALDELVRAGLIVREPGRPYRVRPVREQWRERLATAQRNYGPEADRESNFAREHGVPWAAFDLTREYETVSAPQRVADSLHVPEGTPVIRRRWTHATGGIMLRVSWSYLVAERFGDTILCDPDEPAWPGGTIAQLAALGQRVAHTRMETRARPATGEEAQILGLDGGDWVLETWRIHYTGAGYGIAGGSDDPVECALHVRPASSVVVTDIPVVDREPFPKD